MTQGLLSIQEKMGINTMMSAGPVFNFKQVKMKQLIIIIICTAWEFITHQFLQSGQIFHLSTFPCY